MKEIYDLDTFIYRCGFAAEKKEYLLESVGGTIVFDNKKDLNSYVKESGLEEGDYTVWTHHKTEPIEHSLANLRSSVSTVHKRVRGRKQIFFLSGRNNFRERIATTRPYKGNRDPDHKPLYYKEMRDYAQYKFGAIVVDGIEADDAAGIEASKDRKNSIIISNDKDLKQISCWHFDWTKEDARPEYIGPREAAIQFYRQILSGDPTDNIEGIPGVGPKKADALLRGLSSPIEIECKIRDCFREYFGEGEGDKKFLENARLVRILRYEEDKERLWMPKVKLSVEAD